MNAFHTIAIPHRDILEGRLRMDVFAADLWDVFKGRGPDEYKDEKQFFQRTYKTEGLTNLLNTVEQRLQGKGSAPVIQLQTPFGGGKTHSLIAMYHTAAKQKVNAVVIVGEKLKTGKRATEFETPWGIIEEQLTKKKGEWSSTPIPPGGEQIRALLEKHLPVLILMDEMIPYLNTADAVKIENKTLCSLTLDFLQRLSNAVSTMSNVALILTATPSNPYDRSERGQEIVSQLQNISERRDIIEAPVQDNEITPVIRQRLFTRIDQAKAEAVIMEFMEYATRESILPGGMEPSEYRKLFEASYPFLPEVVDILYTRWGTFPNFQRTRGVLRLLSMVVHSLKGTTLPYISLADFDLSDQHIRQELLRHAGSEYNSIIASDLTGSDAGAKRIDNSLGDAHKGLKLGSRTATSIFMHSFSGGPEKGTTLGDIKRIATTTQNPAAVVAEAVEQLKGRLFYLQYQGGKYFFSNQPNLWATLQTRMENVRAESISDHERELLRKAISGDKLKVSVWPKEDSDIADTPDLKLIIMKERNDSFMKQIQESKGKTPRVNRNTLFFVTPLDSEKAGFHHHLRRVIALEQIADEKTLNLSDEQKKEIKTELKKYEDGVNEALRRYYRLLFIPSKDGLKEQDMGIPTYGEQRWIDSQIYEKLRSDGEILEKIVPLVLKERYLRTNEFVSTVQLFESGLKTPGEPRIKDKEILIRGIQEGVQQGLFGLGELKDLKPICHYFKKPPSVGLYGNEVIIKEELCIIKEELPANAFSRTDIEGGPTVGEKAPPVQESGTERQKAYRNQIRLKFTLPKGKVSGIMGVVNLLQANFSRLTIEISAEDGKISEQDYEDKVKETFRQLSLDFEE